MISMSWVLHLDFLFSYYFLRVSQKDIIQSLCLLKCFMD